MSQRAAAPIDEGESLIKPDPVAVRAFMLEMIAKGLFVALVEAIIRLIRNLLEVNSELNRKLQARLRRHPPSETTERTQLVLAFMRAANDDGVPAGSGGGKPTRDKKKRGAKKPRAHGRPKLPETLPRVAREHLVADAQCRCPQCGMAASRVNFKITEKLEMVPASWVVVQEKYETVASPCPHAYIFTAERQDEVLDRGILGSEVLVQSLVEHYDEAVPWERMARKAREQGVPLAANTLAKSVGRVIDLFDPIVKHIAHKSLSSEYAALDATSMRILDPDHPLGIRSGTLWLIEGAHKYAYYAYAPTGHSSHLKKLIAGYNLVLVMCDGAQTNNCVEAGGGTRGGCNAHGRRRLVDALRSGDDRALEGLQIFADIFHVDAESKKRGESLAQRHIRRQNDSSPLVDRLRRWVDARLLDVEPKTRLGAAVRYIRNQWNRLTAFLRNPLMELTNNEVERDLRRWVLDRKSWFFCGHDISAKRAADALTIITTCRKHGIDPRRYLRDTLKKLLDGERNLAALLPETYAAAIGPPAVQPAIAA